MKSTFSLALLAGFASATIITAGVASLQFSTTGLTGTVTVSYKNTEALPIDGTITVTLPAELTVAEGAPMTAAIVGETLDGTLSAERTSAQVVLITRTGTPAQRGSTSELITVTFGPVTNGAVGPTAKLTMITNVSGTSGDIAGVTIYAACDGSKPALEAGCNCKTTGRGTPTFTCTVGKKCDVTQSTQDLACKAGGETAPTDCKPDGATKATGKCTCKTTDDAKTTYECVTDQVCDPKGTTKEKACKARASNGSSLLLLAAFFLAMN